MASLACCVYREDLPVHAGVALDKKKAFKLFEKAAKLGHTQAMNDLGVMCYRGEGRPRNFHEAVHWYEKSATPEAINSLGLLYIEGGPGFPVDNAKARKHFEKAKAMGSKLAAYNLDQSPSVLRFKLKAGPYVAPAVVLVAAYLAYRFGVLLLVKVLLAAVALRYGAYFLSTLAAAYSQKEASKRA